MNHDGTKKYRVKYIETTTREVAIEIDAKDPEHAKVMVERVPEYLRTRLFYRPISQGSPSTSDEVIEVKEV